MNNTPPPNNSGVDDATKITKEVEKQRRDDAAAAAATTDVDKGNGGGVAQRQQQSQPGAVAVRHRQDPVVVGVSTSSPPSSALAVAVLIETTDAEQRTTIGTRMSDDPQKGYATTIKGGEGRAGRSRPSFSDTGTACSDETMSLQTAAEATKLPSFPPTTGTTEIPIATALSAIEYDVDSKPRCNYHQQMMTTEGKTKTKTMYDTTTSAMQPYPSWTDKRRRWLYMVLAAVVVTAVVAIAIVVVATASIRSASSVAVVCPPQSDPNNLPRKERIVARIRDAVGYYNDEDEDDTNTTTTQTSSSHSHRASSSPYGKALEWILYEDPMQLTWDAPNLIQRYIAAYLYYATSVDGPWTSCNPPSPSPPDKNMTTTAYCQMSDALGYSDIVPANMWLSHTPECEWAGIRCDAQQQITSIGLTNMNLSGLFPNGILDHWPFLTSIHFPGNELRGPLPSHDLFRNLPLLSSLNLDYNRFTGTIPNEWFNDHHYHIDQDESNTSSTGSHPLLYFSIGSNELTGTIPFIQFGKRFPELRVFGIDHNHFIGSIPSDIGFDMVNMDNFVISHNRFNGTIPTSITNWRRVTYLDLSENRFTGTIPRGMGNMASMVELNMAGNRLTGSIPNSMYNLVELRSLAIHNNNLNGTIATEIGLLRQLTYLDLSHNRFTGMLPDSFEDMPDLWTMFLQGTDLVGTFPRSVCRISSLEYKDFRADCAPDETGYVEMTCTCCQLCCEPNGKNCIWED